MHCIICDNMLSDYEATRKHGITGKYLDLCNTCLRSIDGQHAMHVTDRKDLMTIVDIEEGLDKDEEPCYPIYRDYEET
jgi:hypothetical protein